MTLLQEASDAAQGVGWEDLPTRVLGIIAKALIHPLDGMWLDLHDTVRTYCAVSMVGHALSGLRDALAERLASQHFGGSSSKRSTASQRWSHENTCDELRAAAKAAGLKTSGTKDALVQRLFQHAYTSCGRAVPFIPINVVPIGQRAEFKRGRRITVADAVSKYDLSEADQEVFGVPCDASHWLRGEEEEVWELDIAEALQRLVCVRCVRAHVKAKAARNATLVIELGLLGCELRSDSRLCEGYISRAEGSPVDIAQTMAEMRFLFTETDYEDLLQEEIQGELEDRGRYDRDEVSEMARERALEEYVLENGEDALQKVPAHMRRRVRKILRTQPRS